MTVRIGVYKETNWPFSDICSLEGWMPTTKCLQPGVDVEILRELMSRMNLSYEIVPADTISLMVTMGIEGKLDTAAYTVINSSLYINNNLYAFTHPVMFHPYSILYKPTDESFMTYLLSLTTPFSPFVWLYLFLTVVFMYFVWFVMRKPEGSFKNTKTCFNMPLEFFTFMQGEVADEHVINVRMSKKIFFLSISAFTLVVSALYQNGLLISFRARRREMPLSSLSELVHLLENNFFNIVTNNDEWHFFRRIKQSDGEFFAKMNRIFMKKSYVKVNSSAEVMKYLMTGAYVFPSTPYYLVRKYEAQLCDLAVINLEFEKEWSGYVFYKGSPYLPLINEAIANSWQMINFYLEKYKLIPLKPACADTTSKFALKLNNFVGPVILLFIGCVFGCFAFMLEIKKLWHKHILIAKL